MTAFAEARLLAVREIPLSRSTTYRLFNTGALKAIRIGRRTFIRPEDWADFLASAPQYQPKRTAN